MSFLHAEQSCVLSRQICALQVISCEDGALRWGPVVKLPSGTQVRCYGTGFNKHTVRVQVGDAFYFVFREDIDRESGISLRTDHLTPELASNFEQPTKH